MKNELILMCATAIIITGCSHTQARKDASSGFVGCPPQNIIIKDEADRTWTAICNDKIYYCSVIATSASATVNCKESEKK